MEKAPQPMSDAYQHRGEVPVEESGTDTESGLEELRSLIVGATGERVERMARQLNDPDLRAADVGQVLHRAVAMSATRDGKLASALQPLTESAIQGSIQKNRQAFVDILFPVMGPAIRKAIATTIQGMIQSFNQIMEYSFSLKGLRWRLEALRTRRPFAEVVLLHTLVYQVEQAFLIHRSSGLLIDHVVAKTAVAQNPDLVSAMMTAIKDFVQDSFGGAQDETLDTFQVGRRKVWLEHGPYAMVALVISGNPPLGLREMMRDTLDELHVSALESLKDFSGDIDPPETIRPILDGLLQVQFKSVEPKKAYGAWIVMGLVLLLFCWGIFHWTMQHRRWSRFVQQLHDQPGVVVTHIEKEDGQRHVYGLRDPLAPSSAKLLHGTPIPAESVEFHWEPYQSAFAGYARQRADMIFKPPASVGLIFEQGTLKANGAALGPWMEESRRLARSFPWIQRYDDSGLTDIEGHLDPPDTVSLTLDGDTLHASGSASLQWIAGARQRAASLQGISSYDDKPLTEGFSREWAALARTIDASVFYFKSGKNEMISGQQSNVRDLTLAVKRMVALSGALGRQVNIDIIGHADRTGEEDFNLALSQKRAQFIADQMAAEKIDLSTFRVHAVGARDPLHPEADAGKRSMNRRVTFTVHSSDADSP